jgi:hypothetical protein
VELTSCLGGTDTDGSRPPGGELFGQGEMVHNPAMRFLGMLLIFAFCLFGVVSAGAPSHVCCTQTCEGDGPAGSCDDNCLDRACCTGTPLALPDPILLTDSFDVSPLDPIEAASAVSSADLREIFHVPRSLA